MAVVLQCEQELVKFSSYSSFDSILLLPIPPKKIQNKLSGRRFALFDDVISVEKGDLGAKM